GTPVAARRCGIALCAVGDSLAPSLGCGANNSGVRSTGRCREAGGVSNAIERVSHRAGCGGWRPGSHSFRTSHPSRAALLHRSELLPADGGIQLLAGHRGQVVSAVVAVAAPCHLLVALPSSRFTSLSRSPFFHFYIQ